MEQQQFRVRFPLGTKLLFSILLLLIVVIFFLDASTILILKEDKRAYTYQSQATEALLVGKEMTGISSRVIDTLRLSLASISPHKAVSAGQKRRVQSILNNQTDVVAVQILNLKTKSLQSSLRAQLKNKKRFAELGITDADLKIEKEWFNPVIDDLKANAFTYVNLSKVGKPPLLGIVLADIKYKNRPSGMPVAVGILSLRGFGKELIGSNLTVTNRSGWVLFDSDPSVLYEQTNIAEDPLFISANKTQLTNGATEYEFDGTRYLGSYVRPGLGLVILTKAKWRHVMRATYSLMEKFILLGVMAIGAAVIFALTFAKTLTAPLSSVYEATKEVSNGNFDLKLETKQSDEIGALSHSFNVMSVRIQELIAESMEKVRMEGEMKIAATVQQNFIPPSKFENEFIKIRSHYQSATECGGDWWGFFGVQDKMTIMIADATGHGVGSALMTASARSCFSFFQKLAVEDPQFTFSPGSMLSYMNRIVHDGSGGKIMMTAFMCCLDFGKNELTYSVAGHNPPWLFKKEAAGFKMKSLTGMGHRLGEKRDQDAYPEKVLPIAKGDVLFLYTDGLTEGVNEANEMYNKRQVKKIVEASVPKGPDGIHADLISDFNRHVGKAPLEDDVTLAIATFK